MAIAKEAVDAVVAEAGELLLEERGGWKRGFDRARVTAAWCRIMYICAAYVAEQPEEVRGVLTRTLLKSLGAIGYSKAAR